MKNLLGQSTEWICHIWEHCARTENALGERKEGVGTCVKHFHILWHGELNCVLDLIPFQINTYIFFGFPFHRDCVFLAECMEKMFCFHF